MLDLFWIAQLIGIIALIYQLASFYGRTRRQLLSRQITASVFFVVHFFLLGALTGALTNLVIILRNSVFEEKDEHKKWAKGSGWVAFFILLSLVTLLFSWQGAISVLPVIGVVVSTYARWSGHPDKIRIFSLLSSSLWVPYDLAVGSIAGVLTQVVIIVFIIYAVFRLDKFEHVL